MTDPGIELEEVRRDGQKWLEPRFTIGNLSSILVTALAAAGLYYGLAGRADSQAKDIATLQSAVVVLPSMQTDITVLQNDMTAKSSARDAQVSSVTAQVAALNGRVDKIETTDDNKIDKMADDISTIKSQVAALVAVSGVRQP